MKTNFITDKISQAVLFFASLLHIENMRAKQKQEHASNLFISVSFVSSMHHNQEREDRGELNGERSLLSFCQSAPLHLHMFSFL